jgi:hypothetical protein
MGGIITVTSLLSGCRGYVQTVISDRPLKLSPEPIELNLAPLLSFDRADQEILLTPAAPYSYETKPPGSATGIRTRDGSIAVPEAELVSEAGIRYSLKDISFFGDDMVLSSRPDIPRSVKFTKLILRSSSPVEISKVTFNCYNFKDVKR